MSWSSQQGGTSERVAAGTKKQLDYARPHEGEQANDIKNGIQALADVVAKHYPGRLVTFDTNGHVDQGSASFTVTARVWPNADA